MFGVRLAAALLAASVVLSAPARGEGDEAEIAVEIQSADAPLETLEELDAEALGESGTAVSTADGAAASERDADPPATKKSKKKKKKAEAEATPATIPPGKATPPMWRIADEDTQITLLGTFHILPPGLDWRSDALGRALDTADTLWFEAETDTQAAHGETIRLLKTEGFNKGGALLTGMLEPEDAEKLKTVAAGLGLPIAAIDPMRPWQAFLTLSIQFIVAQGFEPGSGLETSLMGEARARGREIKFFETVAAQLAFFTSLPPKVEKDLLVLTLREWDEQTADFNRLFEAWRTGDIATIDSLMNESMRNKTPEVYDVLLTRRNAEWARRIEAAMATPGHAVIAVGAAHLVGADSVPALLQARGIAVERYGVADDAADAANDNAAADSATDSLEASPANDNQPAGETLQPAEADQAN